MIFFGVTFTDSGDLTGNASILKNNNNLTEHGWAVYQVLTQSLSNFKIIHAGFTPLSQHLHETGILNLSVEERKRILKKNILTTKILHYKL
ncbi:MAG: hypothetical protein IPJ81_13920 [Chitinophagaceae bacterium]|nr:hypothetical protein [Chitinophagaceae bacterium]